MSTIHPDSKVRIVITQAQLAFILASLRVVERQREDGDLDMDDMPHFEDMEVLDNSEIEGLCQHLNCNNEQADTPTMLHLHARCVVQSSQGKGYTAAEKADFRKACALLKAGCSDDMVVVSNTCLKALAKEVAKEDKK